MNSRLPRLAALLALALAGAAAVLLLRREAVEPGAAPVAEAPEASQAAPAEVRGPGRGVLDAGGGPGGRPSAPRTGPDAAGETSGGGGSAATPDAPVDPAGPFQGVCVDEDGRPVPGASIQVMSGRAGRRGIDRAEFPEARAGADGRFEIAAPPAVESVRVRARGAGRVAARADEEMSRGAIARIVLLRAVDVRIRVIEKETGGAVRGARVTLLAGEENANRGEVNLPIHPATDDVATDDTGRAVLRAPGGPCAVLVKAAKRSPRLLAPLYVPAAGMDLTVVMERGGAVRVRVLGDDGQPVVGARVHATARLGWREQGTADGDGAVRLEGLPEAPPIGEDGAVGDTEVVVAVQADGYPLHTFQDELATLLDPLHSEGVWDLRLHRAGPVTGTVTAAVTPFPPGAVVRIAPRDPIPDGIPYPSLPPPVPWTPDGSFRFDDVGVLPVTVFVEDAAGKPLSATWSIEAPGASGGNRATRHVARKETKSPDVRPVRLRVVDAGGRGVAGVPLEIGYGDGRVLHLLERGVTDAEGRALLHTTVSGGLTPCVVLYPHGRPAFSAALPAEADESTEVAVPLPAGREAGRLRRLDGKSTPPGLWVSTRLGRVGAPETTVGRAPVAVTPSGAFVLEGLGEDTHVLTVDAPFVLVQPPPVAPGGSLDLLAVTPAEAVSLQVAVRIEPPSGEEVSWASLSLTDERGTSYAGYLRATGEPGVWLSDPPVPPGVYAATVKVQGYAPVTVPSVRIDGRDRSPRITVPLTR